MPSYRTIESPTVGATYESGPERGQLKPAFTGKRLGIQFTDGIAQVDEEHRTPFLNPRTMRDLFHRTWHLLVQDFGYRDVTPAGQPPVYPLPEPAVTPDEWADEWADEPLAASSRR